jgi:hypothetical protein
MWMGLWYLDTWIFTWTSFNKANVSTLVLHYEFVVLFDFGSMEIV